MAACSDWQATFLDLNLNVHIRGLLHSYARMFLSGSNPVPVTSDKIHMDFHSGVPVLRCKPWPGCIFPNSAMVPIYGKSLPLFYPLGDFYLFILIDFDCRGIRGFIPQLFSQAPLQLKLRARNSDLPRCWGKLQYRGAGLLCCTQSQLFSLPGGQLSATGSPNQRNWAMGWGLSHKASLRSELSLKGNFPDCLPGTGWWDYVNCS